MFRDLFAVMMADRNIPKNEGERRSYIGSALAPKRLSQWAIYYW